MKVRIAIAVSGLCLTLALAIDAKADNLRGFVVNVTEETVQVGLGKRPEGPPRASTQVTQAVTLDENTTFAKWITHQPWGQSASATRTMLTVGSCVDITLRDNAAVAQFIRISLEPPASFWDPCK